MGDVILTTGRLSSVPFIAEGSGRKLYSIEEISYYAVNNIYSIDFSFFNEKLLTFLEEELFLKDEAMKLRQLVKERKSLKDLITFLLCISNLYNREEILSVLKLLDDISVMDEDEKKLHLGFQHLREGNYLLSLSLFRTVLKKGRVSGEDYTKVLMAMGVCLIKLSSFQSAAACFKKAYLYGEKETALLYFLLAEELSSKEEVGDENKELRERAHNLLEEAEKELKKGRGYKELLAFKMLNEDKKKEKLGELIEEFKKEYREGMNYGFIQ